MYLCQCKYKILIYHVIPKTHPKKQQEINTCQVCELEDRDDLCNQCTLS